MSQVQKDRSHWVVKKCESLEDMRVWQIEQWQKASGAERRQAAWELAYDYWVDFKKMNPDELRLQKSITNFRRL